MQPPTQRPAWIPTAGGHLFLLQNQQHTVTYVFSFSVDLKNLENIRVIPHRTPPHPCTGLGTLSSVSFAHICSFIHSDNREREREREAQLPAGIVLVAGLQQGTDLQGPTFQGEKGSVGEKKVFSSTLILGSLAGSEK